MCINTTCVHSYTCWPLTTRVLPPPDQPIISTLHAYTLTHADRWPLGPTSPWSTYHINTTCVHSYTCWPLTTRVLPPSDQPIISTLHAYTLTHADRWPLGPTSPWSTYHINTTCVHSYTCWPLTTRVLPPSDQPIISTLHAYTLTHADRWPLGPNPPSSTYHINTTCVHSYTCWPLTTRVLPPSDQPIISLLQVYTLTHADRWPLGPTSPLINLSYQHYMRTLLHMLTVDH